MSNVIISSEERRKAQLASFEKLLDVLDILREQCPWDKKQTNLSLRPNTVEEVYELSDALLSEDSEVISKELGDVLLHVVFYAKIGAESGIFDIKDVCDKLVEKLIYRHPHIFGTTTVKDAHEVEQNWEQLKLKEKGGNKMVLSGVPKSLPSLIKAYRIQEKVANVGFDWEEPDQVWSKVKEELGEFQTELKKENSPEAHRLQEMEFGDLLFSLVNAGRKYGLNADTALSRTNDKFTHRFNYIETRAKALGKELSDMTLAEMDEIYNESKTLESK